MSFEVTGLFKSFGLHSALVDVSLRVGAGELVALLGPSGCGKTTLLRVLAGLETPDAGAVIFDGVDVTRVAPADRNVGLVFQHYALFEHMTVFENVAFALRVRRDRAAKIAARVNELLGQVRLREFGARLPSQLSGGQRQRVALARALAAEPRVLLLDEPFGALDARVRQELRSWLRRLHDDAHVTTILVTHDREDAFEVADRVAIMNAGRLEQVGAPESVFREPATAWVMRFLGDVNELPAGFVRPHEIELSRSPPSASALQGRVIRLHATGPLVRVELDLGSIDRVCIAVIDEQRFEDLALECGEVVFVSPRRARVFAAAPDGPPAP